jgi:phosphoenolpyruvate-protein kinase (PTS system EI component)
MTDTDGFGLVPVLEVRCAEDVAALDLDDAPFRRCRVVVRGLVDGRSLVFRTELVSLAGPGRSLRHKRFVERFAATVLGADPQVQVRIEQQYLSAAGVRRDRDLPEAALASLTEHLVRSSEEHGAMPFPRTVRAQFAAAVAAALRSGGTLTDAVVRRTHDADDPGFVGAGFVDTHDLRSGTPRPAVGFAVGRSIDELQAGVPASGELPAEFAPQVEALRRHLAESDGPFAVRRGEFVAVDGRVLVDRVVEPAAAPGALVAITAAAITAAATTGAGCGRSDEAIARLGRADVDALAVTRVVQDISNGRPLAAGVGVAPGACAGAVVTSVEQALTAARSGRPAVFVARAPGPENVVALLETQGAVFAAGGYTAHAAVIARGAGTPCVMGVPSLRVDGDTAWFGQTEVRAGEVVTVDGTTGTVHLGACTIEDTRAGTPALARVLEECDRRASLEVLVNADTAIEAAAGFAVGARGVGLCRIEHLLVRPHARDDVRAVLTGAANAARSGGVVGEAAIDALGRITTLLTADLSALFSVAEGRPVTVRLLDAPLAEFLTEADGIDPSLLRDSMAGLRGTRLLLRVPALAAAQVRAVVAAAAAVPSAAVVEILLPMVSAVDEVVRCRALVQQAQAEHGGRVDPHALRLAAMVETPRSALIAGALAAEVDALSFGTNDLAAFSWAWSRDLPALGPPGSAPGDDPFSRFDLEGVGRLIELACHEARAVRPEIVLRVCGEQAVDEQAMAFFRRVGIDQVSCAASRVLGARLTAGQLA